MAFSADEWKAKGNSAFSGKDFAEAVKCFSQAILLDPSNAVLYSNRSGAYASLEKYDQALEDALMCVQLKPDWAKAYSRKGLAELQLGRVKEAIATYTKGLQLDPTNASLKAGLEQAQATDPSSMSQKHLSMMIEGLLMIPKFKKYAEEDPDYAQRLTITLQEILKDPRNLQLAMALNPDPRITEALKVLLRLPGSQDEDEAQQEIEKRREAAAKAEAEKSKAAEKEASTLNRSSEEKEADSWKEKGNKLYSERKFEEALEAYDKAIELFPSNILYYNNKAAVYLEMKNYEECLKICNYALDKRYELKAAYEKVAKIYCRLAVCYCRMLEYGKAIEMYEKALMEDNNRHTRAALAETKMLKEKKDREDYINPEVAEQHRLAGNEHFKKNEFPEAKKEYDEAIRRNPNDARLYANRSAALMKLLELPMASTDAAKSLELDPKVPKVWARKGNIHMMMKEYNKALNAYQKGLEVDENSIECRRGLEEVLRKIQETTTSGQTDEEQVKRAMADPEIQALLADPQFTLTLRSLSENPSKLEQALKDPHIASGIQKLMAAGILKIN